MSELLTPHAGDDRAADNDVVSLLMWQHGGIRNLFDEVEKATGDERRDAFRRLVRLLAVYETAEERYEHIRRSTDAANLAAMAKAVKAAEAMAPTRPHPGVESGAANMELGPAAALMDRTKDGVRKATGKKGG
ncbi:hypothetical protein ACOBQB_06280 [Streptomyces sp. G5(2025)]|uniref:hypothetical protein n=1 Tax=Streptomyces sp. G5(2025) TaxID=3406628 RepID=UPI003C1713AD